MPFRELSHFYFYQTNEYRSNLYMKIFHSFIFIAFFCALPCFAFAQVPQQNNVSEVRHFPNPAGSGGMVSISFNLPTASYVNIKIFNPLGIELKVLTNGTFTAGEHSIPLDVSNFNDGVYFYTVRVNDHSETKKLTVKK